MTAPTEAHVTDDEFARHCLATMAYLDQGEWWYPKPPRPRLRVSDMDARWRRNSARWMERRAELYALRYTMGEVLQLMQPTMRAVIGKLDGEVVLSDRLYSHWDLMSETVQDDMDRWQTERDTDPVGWLRSTKLYRALITAPCCNGTGMADYAAVPCPAPDCPVPPPGSPPEAGPRPGRHLSECPLSEGQPFADARCTCNDYSPEWTLS